MKKRVCIVTIVLFFVILLLIIIVIKNNIKNQIKYDFSITTVETKECFGVYELVYKLSGNTDLYTYCLDDFKIGELSLSEFIKEQGNSILNKIYGYMDNMETLSDGKSKIYTTNKESKFTNNGLKIIVCNTNGGNKNIYFGPLSMDEDFLCQE